MGDGMRSEALQAKVKALSEAYRRKPPSWWLRRKPLVIGRLTLFTNEEAGVGYLCRKPLAAYLMSRYRDTKSLWKEYGRWMFGVRVSRWWLRCHVRVGSKCQKMPYRD